MRNFTLQEIFDTDHIPDQDLPWLDRQNADLESIDSDFLRRVATDWRRQGFVHIAAGDLGPGWSEKIVAYTQKREELPVEFTHYRFYEECPELLSLATHANLARAMHVIVGEPCGLHLTLCGWRSTRRDWHQDRYLSGEFLKDHYVAAWIALDDIKASSGPFKAIAGSHRWPKISMAKIQSLLKEQGFSDGESYGPDWPWHSESIITSAVSGWLAVANQEPYLFLPNRGDVLLWHPRLMHGGSIPEDDRAVRKCVIAHYSGIHHRPDMPHAKMSPGGGWYFHLKQTC